MPISYLIYLEYMCLILLDASWRVMSGFLYKYTNANKFGGNGRVGGNSLLSNRCESWDPGDQLEGTPGNTRSVRIAGISGGWGLCIGLAI